MPEIRKGAGLKMSNYKSIRASIYSSQTDKTKRIIDRIREETADLTADELGTLSILFGLDRMIKEESEKAGKIVKFPTVANLEAVEK